MKTLDRHKAESSIYLYRLTTKTFRFKVEYARILMVADTRCHERVDPVHYLEARIPRNNRFLILRWPHLI
jgi:hypothetical protein